MSIFQSNMKSLRFSSISRQFLPNWRSTKFSDPCIRHIRSRSQRLMPIPRTEKRLDVVIIGAPNAGKSVLLNTLIQTKLAATTRKRHTTRNEILGVFNHRNVQLAFYDTPGFVSSNETKRQDVRVLRSLAKSSLAKADVVLLVVDSTIDVTRPAFQDSFAEMAKLALDNAKTEIILVLNKVDLVVPKKRLLEITYSLVSLINGVKLGPEGASHAQLDTTTFMISALKDDGVIDLKNYLIAISKTKPWIIPKETVDADADTGGGDIEADSVAAIDAEYNEDGTKDRLKKSKSQGKVVTRGSSTGLDVEKDGRSVGVDGIAETGRNRGRVTTLTIEERVEEIILEALMENTHEEIPYIADIVCKSISPLTSTRVRIDVDIKVDTSSQQRIIVGQQGRTLLKIRSAATELLEPVLGKQVILYLWAVLRNDDKKAKVRSANSTH